MMASYSVVIPAFNASRYIEAAISSVRAQTVPPVEIIVVDDGSTDGTAAAAKAAGAFVVSLPMQSGPSTARNIGVKLTSAPLVAFLDADDLWLPEHAASLLPAFDVALTVFAGSYADKFGAETGVVRPGIHGDGVKDLRDMLLLENPINQSATMVRRTAFDAAGGYEPTMNLSEDYDLWNRMAERGSFHFVDRATIRRRMHAGQLTQQFRAELVRAWWKVRRRAVARRLPGAEQLDRRRVFQLLERAAQLDVDFAIWTGDSALLAIVREELRSADAALELDQRLSAAGGSGLPARRLSQDVRCGSRTLLQLIQGQR
jgi:glycosyltransferase involved in cell wall biosynthesis